MSIMGLWMPILCAAVLAWILSALVWMVFGWHKNDYAKTRDEEAARAALRGMSPGYYSIPFCPDFKEMSKPEMQKKMQEGPVATLAIMPSGPPKMGGMLVASFIYNILVSVLCAYMVSRTLTADASYLQVFRVAGTTAFAAYGIAYIQESIWFARPYSVTAKNLLDALLYGLMTGGAFGWLS
ncbi:MAG: hypothetical protein L0Y45_00080 [Woeseiaceae bacterium]|nr:hypothetical protein [Woeseiaceae bacterium]